jgi:hypothetical protein
MERERSIENASIATNLGLELIGRLTLQLTEEVANITQEQETDNHESCASEKVIETDVVFIPDDFEE